MRSSPRLLPPQSSPSLEVEARAAWRGAGGSGLDLEEEVDARVLIFESVAGEGRDTGWAAPAPALSGRVQCYRLQ